MVLPNDPLPEGGAAGALRARRDPARDCHGSAPDGIAAPSALRARLDRLDPRGRRVSIARLVTQGGGCPIVAFGREGAACHLGGVLLGCARLARPPSAGAGLVTPGGRQRMSGVDWVLY